MGSSDSNGNHGDVFAAHVDIGRQGSTGLGHCTTDLLCADLCDCFRHLDLGKYPAVTTMVGAAVIIVAGLYVIYRESNISRSSMI